MGQLIDDDESGGAFDGLIDIEFGNFPSAIRLNTPRQHFEAGKKSFRLLPAMGFRNPDDDIDTLFPPLLRGFEHRIGFPDARGGAEEDLKVALTFALFFGTRRIKQVFGIGSFSFHVQDTGEFK